MKKWKLNFGEYTTQGAGITLCREILIMGKSNSHQARNRTVMWVGCVMLLLDLVVWCFSNTYGRLGTDHALLRETPKMANP